MGILWDYIAAQGCEAAITDHFFQRRYQEEGAADLIEAEGHRWATELKHLEILK